MDLIGDLALIGRPLKGRIIATRPGHTINAQLAKALRSDIRRQEVQAPFYNPNVEPLMDNNAIRRSLPHRYPFLLVDKGYRQDRALYCGREERDYQRAFLPRPLPQEPVMPGVLLGEAMAQTGGLLVLASVDGSRALQHVFHEDRQCEVPPESCPRRHSPFPRLVHDTPCAVVWP